jgi:hypothetical protein
MRIWPPIVTAMLGVGAISGTGHLLSSVWVVRETGGFLGHHVIARTGLDRSPVKVMSPAERGRSAAKNLDRDEASPSMSRVMARRGSA